MKNDVIFIRQAGVLKRLNLSDVLILEGADNYTKFIEAKNFYTVRAFLDDALAGLPVGLFVRIHKKYAVAIAHIEEVDKTCVVVKNMAFPVTRKYYPELIRQLNII